MVRKVVKEKAFLVLLGDHGEHINRGDRRFDVSTLAPWIMTDDLEDLAAAEKRKLVQLLGPCKENIIAICKGNHEDTLSRRYERNVYKELCDALGIPEERRLGYSGLVDLACKRRGGEDKTASMSTLRMFLTHGAGGGYLPGAKANRLERFTGDFRDIDLVAMGHTHAFLSFKRRMLAKQRTSDEIYDSEIVLINTGSFLRGEMGGYAERSCMRPQGIGWQEAIFYPDKRRVEISWSAQLSPSRA